MYKLYIVEDDIGIASSISDMAAAWGFKAKICSDFRHVMEEFSSFCPHLVIIDIGLPFAGGYHWCTEIRRISRVPILFISSASDNMNIIMAMNQGADDFIAKPFDCSVLMARMQALLRRSYDYAVSSPMLCCRGAFLNTDDGTLTFDGSKIELTKNEYRILLCLMENKGRTVSREKLMERLWQTDAFVDDNTLTVNINRLRKKLDGAGLPGFIETKFGMGYLVSESEA